MTDFPWTSPEPPQHKIVTTQWEALLAGADELKREGGGTLWIHQGFCTGAPDECECSPVPIEVPGVS